MVIIKLQDNKNITVVVVRMDRLINNILKGLLKNINFDLFLEHHLVSIERKQWQFFLF